MAVDWKTAEFEALLSEHNLVDEPSVGEERVTGYRKVLGVIALALVAGVCAFLLGTVAGGFGAWYEITSSHTEVANWKVGESHG